MLRLGVSEKGVANSENEENYSSSINQEKIKKMVQKAGYATNSVSSENCKEWFQIIQNVLPESIINLRVSI